MDDRNKELTPPPEHAAVPPLEFTLPPELLPPDTALPGEKAAAAQEAGAKLLVIRRPTRETGLELDALLRKLIGGM